MAAPYPWFSDIEAALGVAPVGCRSLGGGHGAAVYGLEMADGRRLVAKVGGADAGLALEGYMLGYLAAHSALPVPGVVHSTEGLLVMDWLEDDGRLDGAAQEHAAEVVAALHAVTAEGFGHERDTVIAALPQPNKWTYSWFAFFRDQRLLHMAHLAHAAGRLDDGLYRRLERFAERIDDYLEEPAAPSLLHGDMWGGNVLTSRGRVAGFIDPAIYHGHAEVELAFTTLFGTFGEPFFARYQELRPIAPGFFELRRDLYNLYPLLVHVRLFGGGYANSVDRTLRRIGI
jgi:fructosamine-3-kinase